MTPLVAKHVDADGKIMATIATGYHFQLQDWLKTLTIEPGDRIDACPQAGRSSAYAVRGDGMSGVTRSVTIDDISPSELAALFTDMHGKEQAEFFARIWQIAKAWPGAGWCQQSYAITQKLDSDGRQAIETLAAHVLHEREPGVANNCSGSKS